MAARALTAAAMIAAGSLRPADASFSFVTIGDWGGATLGGRHQSNALAVAAQMGQAAQDLGASFVINTGDNFYYCGVQNLSDTQFQADFEKVFTAKSLYVPWYGVLGNHDYAFDVQSQLSYKSPNNDRWQMPARYWAKRVLLGGTQHLSLIFLDTNPCVEAYRSTDPKGWDPCSGEYGNECEMPDGKCYFHDHVVSQDCDAQYSWLQSTLASTPADDWIIVVGHHPAQEITVSDITTLLLGGRVHLYFNGHTHLLNHYRLDGNQGVDFVTSGAGCMAAEEQHEEEHANVTAGAGGHTPEAVFTKTTSGFTQHTFSADFSTITSEFVDTQGNVIHSFQTSKSGAPAPSTPRWPEASRSGTSDLRVVV